MVTVDRTSDVIYVKIVDDKIAYTKNPEPGVLIDYSADGKVVGVELIGILDNGSA